MTPGLAGPPFPSKATKGAIVAVASLEKPTVPIFVGICEIDIASLQKVQGAKGHAVRGQHWAGDEMWAWSQTGKSGSSAPEEIEGWDADETAINSGVVNLTVDDADDEASGSVSVDAHEDPNQQQHQSHSHYVEREDVDPTEQAALPEKELSIKGKS